MESIKKDTQIDQNKSQQVQQFLLEKFGVTLQNTDKYEQFINKDQKSVKINEIINFVHKTPIEDLNFKTTAYDEGIIKNSQFFDCEERAPLLLEVKQFRNLSKPYQRVGKTPSQTGKISVESGGVKRDHTFTLIVHDGVRFIKLILLMPNQASITEKLYERNKFVLKNGYVDTFTEKGMVIILVDGMDQLGIVHNDKSSQRLTEQQNQIQGLPIKYTNAPKFVFLNDQCKESGEKPEAENEDEFEDLYKAMDIHELAGKELIYIKRLEQVGVWRKKFINPANAD